MGFCHMTEKPGGKIPRDILEMLARELYPSLFDIPFSPEDFIRRIRENKDEEKEKVPDDNPDYKAVRLPAYMRDFLSTMNAEDVKKLNKLVELKSSTIEWISQKNDKELQHLDGAVEFIVSSRHASKIMITLLGIAISFIGTMWALAKAGYDVFQAFRGGIR